MTKLIIILLISITIGLTACDNPFPLFERPDSGGDDTPTIYKIAFLSFRDGNNEIYTINSDGTGLTNVSNDAASDAQPVISSDGSKVAFMTNRDGGDWEIYVVNSDGTGLTNVSNDLLGNIDQQASISSDGSKIAFNSNRLGGGLRDFRGE